jgi:hypothetical protein
VACTSRHEDTDIEDDILAAVAQPVLGGQSGTELIDDRHSFA